MTGTIDDPDVTTLPGRSLSADVTPFPTLAGRRAHGREVLQPFEADDLTPRGPGPHGAHNVNTEQERPRRTDPHAQSLRPGLHRVERATPPPLPAAAYAPPPPLPAPPPTPAPVVALHAHTDRFRAQAADALEALAAEVREGTVEGLFCIATRPEELYPRTQVTYGAAEGADAQRLCGAVALSVHDLIAWAAENTN